MDDLSQVKWDETPNQATPISPDASGTDQIKWDDEKPEPSLGQKVLTGVEGAAQGLVGPVAPFMEKMVGVRSSDIRAREEASPGIKKIAEIGGLGAGMLTGTGEAELMAQAGEGASKLAGFGHVLEAEKLAALAKKAGSPELAKQAMQGISYGHKVGSEAVKQIAEMGVLSAGTNASKMIMNDPNTTAETAISDIGLSMALGGLGGGFMAGAVSPIWKATGAPKLEALLGGLKDVVNGAKGAPLAEDVASGLHTLKITPEAATLAGLSTNPTAREIHSTLQRAEKPEVIQGIKDLRNNVAESVAGSAGATPEEVLRYDKNESGNDLLAAFKRDNATHYDPVRAELEARDIKSGPIQPSDEAKLAHYGHMLEQSISELTPGSPYAKFYQEYGDRLLQSRTISDVDDLSSEVAKRGRKFGIDPNEKDALNHITGMLNDFKEQEIGKTLGSEAADEHMAAQAGYRAFAKMENDLMSHLGVGKFTGEGALRNKLSNEVTPELLLKKFSIKNNMDFAPFLEQHFPETYEAVLANERKELLKPSFLSAAKKGENSIDVKKLGDTINTLRAGNATYVDKVLPPEVLSKIEAAKNVLGALPTQKDSGTPAGIAKLFAHLPAGGMAMLAMLFGHNPLIGGILGETAQRLGKDAPEAIKLGYLKFLGSNQPIKAEGFKAMVDYMHAATKGESAITKSIQNVLKPGAQVLSQSQSVTPQQLMKLDKLVAQTQDKPAKFMQAQTDNHVGHYLPEHQTAIAQSTTTVTNYLNSIKPRPQRPNPLDKEIQPTPQEEARYKRAVIIAQQPASILEHVKDGTLQLTDKQDIQNMYPALYTKMSNQLSHEMAMKQAKGESIPYNTRMGLSLFLGQAMDSTMTPASIVAAQPKPQGAPQQPNAQNPGKKSGSPSKLGKTAKSYRTPSQAAESDRSTDRAD